MSTWPSTLPQNCLLNNYQETPRDTAVRSAMGYGPDKVRRRTTAQIVDITMVFWMDDADIAALETFYYTTIQVSGTFDWIHQRTLAAAEYRFMAPPMYAPVGNGRHLVTLQLELLP